MESFLKHQFPKRHTNVGGGVRRKVVPKLLYSKDALAVGRGAGNRMLLTRKLQKSSGRGLVLTARNRLRWSPPVKG